MAAELNQKKIERLFDKLLDKNYQIRTDTYLNRLLTHLTNEKHEIAIRQTFIAEYLKNAITEWHENSSIPNSNITSFLLNLTSFLSKDENFFNLLKNDNFYTKLFHVLQDEKNNIKCPSIKLGYVTILTALLDHNSGILFVTSTAYWKSVIELCLSTHTLYITRECNKFIFKLLQKSETEFLHTVIEEICLPLADDAAVSAIEKSCGAMEICDALIYDRLKSSLQLLYALFENILKSDDFAAKDFKLGLIIADQHKIEARVDNLVLIAHEQDFLFDLQRISLSIYFVQVFSSAKNIQAKNCEKIMNLIRVNLTKDYINNILKLLYLCQVFWGLHGHNIPPIVFNKNNVPLTLGDQFVRLQLIPFVALKNSPRTAPCLAFNDELKDLYVKKLFDLMCECTVRIGYQWRDLISAKESVFDIAKSALNYLMQSKKYLSRERAIVAFQCLVYNFKDIIIATQTKPEIKTKSTAVVSPLLTQMLNLIQVFIEEFTITWRDSVETICVFGISVELLKLPFWPTGFVVQALKLANTSIVKYMSPSLALLVDDPSNMTMAEIASVLHAKLHDGAWEVRDSALEVVCTIANISNTKFPSLQKVIMDSELPSLVLKMSTGDGEGFVRATAIKCLQEMIQVEEIWNNCLKSENLSEKIMLVLRNETEGIVRVEAATFMCTAFEQQQLLDEDLDKVYESMINAATTDLHWEVKVKALNFWNRVINNQLHHQGMIDGTFPKVTFSREHRKIVTLTESEIRRRLEKVLVLLSSNGCLGVLTTAIRDDCDVEVSKKACGIAKKLLKLLKQYKVEGTTSIPNSPIAVHPSPSASMSSGVSTLSTGCDDGPRTPELSNDDIIEQIVNERDVNLLKSVYVESDYGSTPNLELPQLRKIVSPGEFLDMFGEQDLDQVILDKRNWLNGMEDLDSLLDDMLKNYEEGEHEVNTMDCY